MRAETPCRPGWATAIGIALAIALVGGGAPAQSQASVEPTHQAPELESTLPNDLPGTVGRTRSFAGDSASRERDELFLERYILAMTCRSVSDIELAEVTGWVAETEGDPFPPGVEGIQRYGVTAIRIAGADPARLREGYLQARRFVGPPAVGATGSHPYAFAGRAGWRPAEIDIEGRSLLRYDGDRFSHAYVVGDTIYEVEAAAADLPDLIAALPAPVLRTPGTDHSRNDSGCEGPDSELRELLLGMQIGDDLDPYPLPPGFLMHDELARATRDPDSISGYLLGVALGGITVAYRVPGASRRALERACLRMLSVPRRAAKVVDWGGRRVRWDRRTKSACYVHGEMLFALGQRHDARRFIRSIPLPEGSASATPEPERSQPRPS